MAARQLLRAAIGLQSRRLAAHSTAACATNPPYSVCFAGRAGGRLHHHHVYAHNRNTACLQLRSRSRSAHTLSPTLRHVIDLAAHRREEEGGIHDGGAHGSLRVQGWVSARRRQKRVAFVTITDGTASLQVVGPPELCTPDVTVGAAVVATGNIVESPGGGQAFELQCAGLEVIGPCDHEDYVLQNKRHSAEFLREHLHLRCRTEEARALARVRNGLRRFLQTYFHDNEFLQVDTPILTTNDCEGGGDVFNVRAPADDAKGAANDRPPFFGAPTYLTVSGQLHLEVMAGAFPRVFCLSPAFRAENSHTTRHLAEFYMLEAEMAFADLDDNLSVIEACLQSTLAQLQESNAKDLEVLHAANPSTVPEQDLLDNMIQRPFARITYTEALAAIADKMRPLSWGSDLGFEHESWLTKHCGGPVFVTHYPATLRPFYMKQSENQHGPQGQPVVDAVDLLVPRVGELAGGSAREDCAVKLSKRMLEQGLGEEYGWYLDLRRFGSTPHAGFGVGFERLLQLATGVPNIRDTVPFPRHAGACRL